jgi:hypothetical protein
VCMITGHLDGVECHNFGSSFLLISRSGKIRKSTDKTEVYLCSTVVDCQVVSSNIPYFNVRTVGTVRTDPYPFCFDVSNTTS